MKTLSCYCVHVVDGPMYCIPPSNPDGVPYNTIIDKNGMDDEGHAQILSSISALFYFSFSQASVTQQSIIFQNMFNR